MLSGKIQLSANPITVLLQALWARATVNESVLLRPKLLKRKVSTFLKLCCPPLKWLNEAVSWDLPASVTMPTSGNSLAICHIQVGSGQ